MVLTLAVCTIAGTVISLIALCLLARSQAQGAENTRRQMIEEAIAPVRQDRDYWRNRADEFEAELRRRV